MKTNKYIFLRKQCNNQYQEQTYHLNSWSSKCVLKERTTKSEKGYLCKNCSKKEGKYKF